MAIYQIYNKIEYMLKCAHMSASFIVQFSKKIEADLAHHQ